MNHSDLSFPSMTQHVQHLPSSMHIVTQHFTALSRMHACGEISQCERLGELGADPSSPPGLQPNNDMHKLTMIQSSLAKAQTAHGCNFRACPFQVFSAGNGGASLLFNSIHSCRHWQELIWPILLRRFSSWLPYHSARCLHKPITLVLAAFNSVLALVRWTTH